MKKSRIFSKLPKLFILLLVLDLAQVLCIGGIWSGVWYKRDLAARKAMAERLNIEPSWQSLENYISTQFSVGMTRNEVLSNADKIGLSNINIVFIGQMYCEIYSFRLGPSFTTRGGRWRICYDQEENVISVEKVLSA